MLHVWVSKGNLRIIRLHVKVTWKGWLVLKVPLCLTTMYSKSDFCSFTLEETKMGSDGAPGCCDAPKSHKSLGCRHPFGVAPCSHTAMGCSSVQESSKERKPGACASHSYLGKGLTGSLLCCLPILSPCSQRSCGCARPSIRSKVIYPLSYKNC